MSAPLFDRIAVVDWSANASPKTGPDSIWLAVVERGNCMLSNPSTRRAALDEIGALVGSGQRTLLGVDFSLGFPVGTAELAGLVGMPWAATWAELGAAIIDEENNTNNRFEVAAQLNQSMADRAGPANVPPGPFWGCPPSKANASLAPTKPSRIAAWPDEWRSVEHRLRADGRRPFSCWQLLGAGAVGSQSLVGIAALERLRWNLGARVAVWPFETGLDTPPATDLVVAEVWPSLWKVAVPAGVIKDAAQVEATARRLAQLDAVGQLGALFRPRISSAVASSVIEEEGWVLGVTGDGG
jgi:hypothetical protein